MDSVEVIQILQLANNFLIIVAEYNAESLSNQRAKMGLNDLPTALQ